jgi:protein TonB
MWPEGGLTGVISHSCTHIEVSAMFADSLIDSAWPDRSRRGWTTLASFALQALAVGCLLLLPLLYTQGLPKLALLAPLLAPAPPPALQPAPPQPATPSPAQSNLIGIHLLAPAEIPAVVSQLTETAAPPPVDPAALGVNHGTGDPRSVGTVIDSILGSGYLAAPPAPSVAHHPPVSHMMEGNLIRRVEPRFPPLAIQARIQGQVVLLAMISRSGMIENLRLVSGHPMLAQAAIDAVSQWRYRPYVLNGEPVDVQTQVTVNFTLSKD